MSGVTRGGNGLMDEWRAKRAKEDELLHDMLHRAIGSGRVIVHTDARMLDFEGSPVHSQWDHLVPLLALMSLAMVVLLSTGVAFGIVAMTFGVLFHLYGNKHLVAWRLRGRAITYMLTSPAHWAQLWHLGGIALVLKGTHEPPCVAPQGDWRKFARRNLPEDAETPQPTIEAAPEPAQEAAPEPEILDGGGAGPARVAES